MQLELSTLQLATLTCLTTRCRSCLKARLANHALSQRLLTLASLPSQPSHPVLAGLRRQLKVELHSVFGAIINFATLRLPIVPKLCLNSRQAQLPQSFRICLHVYSTGERIEKPRKEPSCPAELVAGSQVKSSSAVASLVTATRH